MKYSFQPAKKDQPHLAELSQIRPIPTYKKAITANANPKSDQYVCYYGDPQRAGRMCAILCNFAEYFAEQIGNILSEGGNWNTLKIFAWISLIHNQKEMTIQDGCCRVSTQGCQMALLKILIFSFLYEICRNMIEI